VLHAPLFVALTLAQGQGLVFPSDVALVQVVVSVTAKDGVPIRDLEAKDFVVRENGKLRKIETFLRMKDAADSDRAPVDLVLLLDISSSMTKELARARDAIVDFANAVPSFARGRVLAFDRDAYDRAFDPGTIASVLDQMIQEKGGAGTRIYDAVIDGAKLVSTRGGRRVMVLFTDGDDATSRRKVDDAVRALQETEVVCYVVSYAPRLAHFRNGADMVRDAERALGRLSMDSGGFVVDGTSPDVVAQLKRIVDDIKALYVIGFTAEPSKKPEHRRLKVEIERRDVTVRHREGYESRPR
jgi:Ca-activated chloride channel family protein